MDVHVDPGLPNEATYSFSLGGAPPVRTTAQDERLQNDDARIVPQKRTTLVGVNLDSQPQGKRGKVGVGVMPTAAVGSGLGASGNVACPDAEDSDVAT